MGPNSEGAPASTYCISHVELTISYTPRTLAITQPGDGGLAFGYQQHGTASASRTVTVKNTSELTIKLISPFIEGADGGVVDGGAFTVAPPPGFDGGPFDLAPDAGASFTVTFTPTADGGTDGGEFSGTLSFASNDTDAGFPANTPKVGVSLSGTGVPFAAHVSPASLSFGEQRVNSTSTARLVTVRNVGAVSSPFNIRSVFIGNGEPFEVTTDAGFPLTLPVGSSASFPVTFKPTEDGADQVGTLTIETTDSRGNIPVPLWGTGVQSTIELSPDAGLSFAAQRVNTTSGARTVTVSNPGSAQLNVNAVAITSGPYEVLRTDGGSYQDGGFQVEPDGGTHTLSVRFRPTSVGNQLGTLAMTSDDPRRPTVNFPLSGTGVQSTIELSPDAGITFAAQRVRTTSDPQTVTVSNPGSAQLNVSAVAITSGPYEVLRTDGGSYQDGGFQVEPDGGTHTLSVRFRPTAEGNQPGTLAVTSDDPQRPTVNLALSGTGMKPTIVLSPDAGLTFAAQRENTISDAQTAMVSNPGSETLRVSRVETSGPFAVLPTTGFDLAPGGSQPLSVTFAPLGQGPLLGTLSVFSNDPDRPTATVSLSGSGVKPTLKVTPNTSTSAPLDFSEQRVNTSSVAQDVTLSNEGSGPITINTVTVSAASPFSVNTNGPVPIQLASGQSRVLKVTFSPTSEGVLAGSLTLTTDYQPTPSVTVYLSGQGVKPTVQASPMSIDFGSQTVGTGSDPKILTVRNTGSGTLKITDIQVSGPFRLDSTLPFNLLNAGSSEPLEVTFHPIEQNSVNGSITFKTNDPTQSTVTINLAGDGEVLLHVSTNAIDFGDVPAKTFAERDVTFTNRGTFAITLNSVSSSSSRFSLEDFAPVILTPVNPSKTFKARFTPGTTGAFEGIITVVSTADNSPHSISLLGKGTEARMQLTVDGGTPLTSLDFGSVEVNSTKQATVRLTNTGGAPLDMTGASVANRLSDGGTAFTYLGSSSYQNIAPDGGFVDFQVAFAPTANVPYSAVLVLTAPNAVNSPLELPLGGSGTSARIGLSATNLQFGNQRAGYPSTRPLFIKNEGTAPLRIVGLSFTRSDYSISSPKPLPSPQNPLVVDVRDTVGVDVVLTPTVTGAVNDSLTISSNAIATDGGTSVTLTGNGIDGFMVVNPIEIIFDGGVEVGASSTPRPVRVTNDGGYPLVLNSATIQNPAEQNSFFISGFPSGFELQPGASQEFFVTFTPAVNGYQSGTLAIASDSFLNPSRSVTVSGTGVGAEVELLRSSIGFGKANVGTPTSQMLSIRNKGVRTLEIYDIAFEKKTGLDGGTSSTPAMALDFSVERSADGGSLFPMLVDAGSFTSVPLRFAPTAVGARLAQGSISANAKNVKFDVDGEGTAPDLVVTPPELIIDGVLVGTDSAPKSVTITNRGSGSISLKSIQLSGAALSAFTKTHSQTPIRLDPNLSAVVVMTFKPTEEQPVASVQLLVEPDAPGVPSIQVPVLGVGVRQPVSVESELDFGQQLVENTSLARTLNITNNTDARVTLSDIRVLGAAADSIQFTPERLSLPIIMAKGVPVPLKVTFRPRVLADVNAVLQLSFAELNAPLEVALKGKGIPAVLSINPSSVKFDGVRAETGVREEPITFLNLSSDPITLAPPEVKLRNGEHFTFDFGSLEGQQLMPGVPIIKRVKYQPTKEGFSETVLGFTTTVPLVPKGVDLQFIGTAVRSILGADVTSLDFGRVEKRVEPPVKTITVTNKSDQLQRVLVSLTTTEETPFSVDGSGLAESIPPGKTATFSVKFKPVKAGEVENMVRVSLQGVTTPELEIPVKGYGQILTGSGSGCTCGSTEAGSAALMALLALVGVSSRRRRRG
jgi:MYXO-CTERM domain-containing protein